MAPTRSVVVAVAGVVAVSLQGCMDSLSSGMASFIGVACKATVGKAIDGAQETLVDNIQSKCQQIKDMADSQHTYIHPDKVEEIYKKCLDAGGIDLGQHTDAQTTNYTDMCIQYASNLTNTSSLTGVHKFIEEYMSGAKNNMTGFIDNLVSDTFNSSLTDFLSEMNETIQTAKEDEQFSRLWATSFRVPVLGKSTSVVAASLVGLALLVAFGTLALRLGSSRRQAGMTRLDEELVAQEEALET